MPVRKKAGSPVHGSPVYGASRRARNVVLYELSEVPWEIIDLYVKRRPGSTLASTLENAACLMPVADSENLVPWCTWPSFHTGLHPEDHNYRTLGQDPETFRGEPIWDVAERAGLRVGLFGVPQSWPPRDLMSNGFWVPDTFARDAQTSPTSLSRFQEFNLAMTATNAFSSNAPLDAAQIVRMGAELPLRGLTMRSTALLMRQLVRERRDPRWKAGRAVAQALPAFDLFWRLHTFRRPNLSLFFTNHVAGTMHRYWGDAVLGYTDLYEYEPDEVFGQFLFDALDIFDNQLRRILRWIAGNPSTVLVIASAFGQGAIEHHPVHQCYVLSDTDRLTAALDLRRNEPVEAMMYPEYSFQFETREDAEHGATQLSRVELGGKSLFRWVSVAGRTLTTGLRTHAGDDGLVIRALDGEGDKRLALQELGVTVRERLGGGNTGGHIPEGIWMARGRDIEPDLGRAPFSILEAKARILDLLGAGD
jgi:hypothetical protein